MPSTGDALAITYFLQNFDGCNFNSANFERQQWFLHNKYVHTSKQKFININKQKSLKFLIIIIFSRLTYLDSSKHIQKGIYISNESLSTPITTHL